jgi:hypothetical protein
LDKYKVAHRHSPEETEENQERQPTSFVSHSVFKLDASEYKSRLYRLSQLGRPHWKILWLVDGLIGNDREISNYKTTVAK